MPQRRKTSQDAYDVMFHVPVIGDAGVGKTSLLNRVMSSDGGGSASAHAPTLNGPGITFRTRNYTRGTRTARVQFWDAPGSDRYMKLTSRYCAGAAAVVFVFDLTSRASLDHLEDWIRESERSMPQPLGRILIGNKIDELPSHRQVTTEQGLAFAQARDIQYFETSAANNIRVNDSFNTLLALVMRAIADFPEPRNLARLGVRLGSRIDEADRLRQALFVNRSAPSNRPKGSSTADWL